MFDALEKYQNKDHFFFRPDSDLEKVCNAPKDKNGVFVVYELSKGRIELVYIGFSGKVNSDGTINKDNSSLFDTIVNETDSNGVPRKVYWKKRLIRERIDALDIYWYVTSDNKYNDIPAFVQNDLVQFYIELYGKRPRWRK